MKTGVAKIDLYKKLEIIDYMYLFFSGVSGIEESELRSFNSLNEMPYHVKEKMESLRVLSLAQGEDSEDVCCKLLNINVSVQDYNCLLKKSITTGLSIEELISRQLDSLS